ncbi:metallophosphoesterase, partial [bacterium]|nr:metallophosphoesterase [bacterium]
MNFNIPTAAIHRITFKQETSATKQNRGGSNRSLSTNQAAFERNPESDSFEFSIGYINDTHGQTNNMMRILSGLKGDLKLSAGDNDIGDEKNKNVHKATYKFLNIAGVVASALGNHEMDTTQADLIDSLNGYNGDLLAVNLKKDMLEDQDPNDIAEFGRDHLEEKLKGSKIVEVKGEKVGLIGASPMDMFERLTHGNYHLDCHVDELEDTIDDIQDEIDSLKGQGINKIILLSHLGHKRDQIVAKNTEGIDIIIGGHTHELLEGIREGENLFYSKTGEPVVLTEAGKDGNYFGQLNVAFDKDGVLTKVQNNIGETHKFHKNMIHQYMFDEILG